MNEADLITTLPTNISYSILGVWTALKDVARLDSAFCNVNRNEFQELIRSEQCVHRAEYISDENVSKLEWAALRCVRVSNVSFSVFGDDLPCEKVEAYSQLTGDSVETLMLFETCKYNIPCRHLIHLVCPLAEDTCSLIGANPSLRTLTITGALDARHCGVLSEVTLPALKELNVNTHRSLPFQTCLLSLVRTTRCLEELGLGGGLCQLRSETWTAIAQHCSKLRVFDMSHILMSDTSLEELVRLCPHITSLSVTNNELLTDAGVLSVARHLPKLHVLYLRHCRFLTDNSLLHIGEHCAALEDHFSEDHFSEAAVAALQAKRGALRVHLA